MVIILDISHIYLQNMLMAFLFLFYIFESQLLFFPS